MFGFHDLDALQTTLDALASRELVERLPRRPGQKEDRYRQLLGGNQLEDAEEAETPAPDSGGDYPPNREAIAPETHAAAEEPLPVPVDTPETERIEALEQQVGELTAALAELRGLVDDLRRELGV
jgi:uncharacterized protein YceH (UPF0502 family)